MMKNLSMEGRLKMDTAENIFQKWLEQEKARIREEGRTIRVISIFLAVLTLPLMLTMLTLLLDGGGITNAVALIFMIAVGIAILSLGSYKRRLIKPLLESVRKELQTDTQRQEFARQMNERPIMIAYAPVPQGKACEMIVAADYCYYRQPYKSRIIKNREIKKAVLEQESYIVGRGHWRLCYGLKLFTLEDEKTPVWTAYFKTEEELYAAFAGFQKALPAEVAVCDNIAYGNTDEGRKKRRRKELVDIIKVFVMVAILYVIYRLI